MNTLDQRSETLYECLTTGILDEAQVVLCLSIDNDADALRLAKNMVEHNKSERGSAMILFILILMGLAVLIIAIASIMPNFVEMSELVSALSGQ